MGEGSSTERSAGEARTWCPVQSATFVGVRRERDGSGTTRAGARDRCASVGRGARTHGSRSPGPGTAIGSRSPGSAVAIGDRSAARPCGVSPRFSANKSNLFKRFRRWSSARGGRVRAVARRRASVRRGRARRARVAQLDRARARPAACDPPRRTVADGWIESGSAFEFNWFRCWSWLLPASRRGVAPVAREDGDPARKGVRKQRASLVRTHAVWSEEGNNPL